MKKLYLIFAMIFSFAITFNTQAQETVIAVWDFADNSTSGVVDEAHAAAANHDFDYLESGSGAVNGADCQWENTEPEGNYEHAYTVTTGHCNVANGFSPYMLNNINLGAADLVDGKLHLSMTLKSMTITMDDGDGSTPHDWALIYLRDSDDNRLGGVKISPNLPTASAGASNVRIDHIVQRDGAAFGSTKLVGHLGAGNFDFPEANMTFGTTMDFVNNTQEFWVGSPSANTASSLPYTNNSNLGAISSTTVSGTAVPVNFADKVFKFMQTQIRVSQGGNFEIDQIKISTGTYENTVEAGNVSTGGGDPADCSFDVQMTNPGSYPGEITWSITDADGNELASGTGGDDSITTLGMSFGETYTLNMADSYGDGWNGGILTVGGVSYTMDGSSATEDISCTPDCSYDVQMTNPGSYPGEITWLITDFDGNEVASGTGGDDSITTLAMSFGDTYTLYMADSYGDGWNGGILTVNGVEYTIEAGSSGTGTFECSEAVVLNASVSTFANTATFSFATENFEIGGPGSPHLHYSLNGGSTVMVYSNGSGGSTELDADGTLTLTDLPDGDHSIVFSLVDAGHQPLSPPVDVTVAFSTTVNAYSGTYPFCNGFEGEGEGSLGGWTSEFVSGDVHWTAEAQNSNGSVSPLDGAWLGALSNSSTTPDVSNLVSPQMDLTGLTSPQLTFNYTQVAWTPDQDELRVWYKASASDAWTQIFEDTSEVTEWTEVTIPLPNASADYYVAFNGTAKWGRGITLDNICIGDPAPPNVTFSVDMSNYNLGNGLADNDTVWLNGSFTDWCGDGCDGDWNQMFDEDNDGIYTITIPLADGSYEYKITVNGWGHQEQWPGGDGMVSCPENTDDGQYENRLLTVAGEDIVLPTHYYGLCYGMDTVDITLSVNTANIAVGENGMYAGGGSLGGAMALPLTDDGTGVWSATFTGSVLNSYTNYVFLNSPANDGDWDAKENLEGQECADTNSWNDRQFPEITGDVTLLHCFGSCETDGSCPVSSTDLKFQGVLDFTVNQGAGFGSNDGKAVHLVATADIGDLSAYTIWIWANGNTESPFNSFTLPAVSASSGDHILVARNPEAIAAYMTASYNVIIDTGGGWPTSNGNDYMEITNGDTQGSTISDTFGIFGDNPDTTGSGCDADDADCWDHEDAWAWLDGENGWIYGEVNCTDGSTTMCETSCVYPFAACPGEPNTVYADPSYTTTDEEGNEVSQWIGYMTVYDLLEDGSQGNNLWGSPWGVSDVATTLNTDPDYMTITLEPNYNTYADNPTDAYWVNQETGEGAKFMHGTTQIESWDAYNFADLTFSGYVYQNTLSDDYTASFFIKCLDPDQGWTDILEQAYEFELPGQGEMFTVTVPGDELPVGKLVQFGFTVYGANANPADQATNGSIILGPDEDAPLSIDAEDVLDMRIYPNPVNSGYVTILSPVNGTKYIEVFDINGRQVLNTSINNSKLDVSSINSGFYMIKVTINGQTKISKLIVR